MSKSVTRDDIVAYLDEYLSVATVPDRSPNGLQVQGKDRVRKIAFAVDAAVLTIDAAAKSGAQMLIVHHGLWWGHHVQIVGTMHQRVSRLIKNDLSLYTAHIPLDCHPEVGNNVELARLFGLTFEQTFGDHGGIDVGCIAVAPKAISRARFATMIEKKLKAKPLVLPFGPGKVKRVAIISGGAAMEAEAAALAGCDTFVTGESTHAAYHLAREAGINLICGGHYATETVGLKALSKLLKRRYDVEVTFLNAPTGI